MKSTKKRERAVASDPPSRLRAPAGKAERSDPLEKTSALARRSLGEGGSEARGLVGGEPPRLRRGAVETPPVQSVERALSVLEAVARSPEPVPLAHLTEVLGIDPSSAFRLANPSNVAGSWPIPTAGSTMFSGPPCGDCRGIRLEPDVDQHLS